jgi:hypothetical protein
VSQQPGFAQRMAVSLTSLKATQGLTPIMSNNENTATYEIASTEGATKRVVLKRNEGGLWYIQDM